jgi:hypothetical protein
VKEQSQIEFIVYWLNSISATGYTRTSLKNNQACGYTRTSLKNNQSCKSKRLNYHAQKIGNWISTRKRGDYEKGRESLACNRPPTGTPKKLLLIWYCRCNQDGTIIAVSNTICFPFSKIKTITNQTFYVLCKLFRQDLFSHPCFRHHLFKFKHTFNIQNVHVYSTQ